MNDLAVNDPKIKSRIFTIRNVQVMIDRDLAELYGVNTKRLNEQVKRNAARFPESFRFQLTDQEKNELVANCDRFASLKHSTALPYAFTEQGVSMLSAVLKSDTAIAVSIRIIETFVSMRRFMSQHALVFERMDAIERRQYSTDTKVDAILDALEAKDASPAQGVFFDGQIFDAYAFFSDLVRSASKTIVLIDNYVDDTTLTLLSKNQQVDITIFTQSVSKQLALDIAKYNSQYKPIAVKELKTVHDRFLVLDDERCYLIGASLKDLGKKVFGFSIIDNSLISGVTK
ncbi:ORF6N domain-containing protein [Thiomicrospira microaerophila]|uniref:ORF6N domain-containing protein n=1 Tax=Thiomicrospira microaerophila TaxID=406020 RepID=UPI0005C8A790|nr:ORF6N domain-containing protein [Thiomicrospira microaerophila]